MKALVYHKFGGADVLEWTNDWPMPELEPASVLIKVCAGGVNPKDAMLRQGKFPKVIAREPLPRVSGFEVAGEIVKVGNNVRHFKPDDHVFGMTNRFCGGVHAEYAALNENEIELKPERLSMAEAAAMPLAGQTALQALRDYGKVTQGNRVLINGASGGVGHFAVQIARAHGAEVVATCSARNKTFVHESGADKVIDYRETPATEISGLFDCVFDVFGQYSAGDFSRQLAAHGIYVSTVPKLSTLCGEAMARLRLNRKRRLVIVQSRREDLRILSNLVAEKKLKPSVEKVYGFHEAGDAHRRIESKRTRGKIVLVDQNSTDAR